MYTLNPHKPKYHHFYMSIAIRAAEESVAIKQQVGAVVVTPTGMLSTGWNGTPPGMSNSCEMLPDTEDTSQVLKTHPYVIHAEENALYKMMNTGVPTHNSILFTTHSPCIRCAKLILMAGIKEVLYIYEHTNLAGLNLLEQQNVLVTKFNFS